MASVFISMAPEWSPVHEQLVASDYRVREHSDYREYVFDDELVVDRVTTGLRHALWYSLVAGIDRAHVVQFDKTQLRVVADED